MADSESIACPSSAVAEFSIEPTAPYIDVPPQDEAAATLTDSPHGDGPDSGISRVAGRYRIVKPHGSGGLGRVYVAEDTELGRRVAVKEIRQRYAIQGENLLGSFYPRYFGYYERAITIYTHLSDQQAVYYTQAISCAPREASYLIDGLPPTPIGRVRIPASNGPNSALSESIAPRTAFALVSSVAVVDITGSSAE